MFMSKLEVSEQKRKKLKLAHSVMLCYKLSGLSIINSNNQISISDVLKKNNI